MTNRPAFERDTHSAERDDGPETHRGTVKVGYNAGLSRRRSRVRVPSAPLGCPEEKSPAVPVRVSDGGGGPPLARCGTLRPFIRYYGGKWRAAPLYPAPLHRTIVEPFAGAAGYSLRHRRHDVVLVEKYAVSPAEVLRVPLVESVDDLPSWVPAGARVLVGFQMVPATHHPSRNLTAWSRERGWGWTVRMRHLVASQVDAIKHWRIIEGDYTEAPDVEATWFVDPPYNNRAGSHYPCGSDRIDYAALGEWSRARLGQTIVCENEGADWLPFRPFAQLRRGLNKGEGSREAIWTNGPMGQLELEVRCA
jgi:hypothetical protein